MTREDIMKRTFLMSGLLGLVCMHEDLCMYLPSVDSGENNIAQNVAYQYDQAGSTNAINIGDEAAMIVVARIM
jgi:hypothetical protein